MQGRTTQPPDGQRDAGSRDCRAETAMSRCLLKHEMQTNVLIVPKTQQTQWFHFLT